MNLWRQTELGVEVVAGVAGEAGADQSPGYNLSSILLVQVVGGCQKGFSQVSALFLDLQALLLLGTVTVPPATSPSATKGQKLSLSTWTNIRPVGSSPQICTKGYQSITFI